MFGVVFKKPTIFNASILENIIYGKHDATNSEILDVSKSVNAERFIESNLVSEFGD